MRNVEEYIKSGILEMYVLGFTSEKENREIEEMSALHSEIRNEIDEISDALLMYSEDTAPGVNRTIKPMVMAVIDYTERLKKGEIPSIPPLLNKDSKPGEYEEWLKRRDMVLPADFNDIHAKLIGHVKGAMTAIVWIKESTPYEVHDQEYERFLIVEGTCDIIIDEKPYSLVPGDYMQIPLHAGHLVKVTSEVPCKVILQRVAA
jgi:mannose-6-phosphate isomerase-like protein (cupin superfamily)